MRILLVEPYSRMPGHFAWFALRIAEGFANLGHQVTLVTFGGINRVHENGFMGFTILDAANRSKHPLEGSAGNDAHVPPTSFIGWRKLDFRTLAFVASHVRQHDFDVVHFLDSEAVALKLALTFLMAKRKSGGRINLLTVHSLKEITTATPGLKRGGYRWLYELALRRLIANDLSGVVALTEPLKLDIVDRFRINPARSSRIRVIPLGMDQPHGTTDRLAARVRLNLPREERVFLILGHLRRDKRMDLAIEALSGLPSGYLVIAGEVFDFDPSQIGQWIENHQCQERTRTELRYLSEERMREYLAAADAVVLPYSESFKGQSGVLTRACSYGRSVIVSDTGGLGETVRREGIGLVVEPDCATSLRAGMLKFLELSAEERLQMEIRSRATADQYSWTSVCRKLAEYYVELSAAC